MFWRSGRDITRQTFRLTSPVGASFFGPFPASATLLSLYSRHYRRFRDIRQLCCCFSAENSGRIRFAEVLSTRPSDIDLSLHPHLLPRIYAQRYCLNGGKSEDGKEQARIERALPWSELDVSEPWWIGVGACWLKSSHQTVETESFLRSCVLWRLPVHACDAVFLCVLLGRSFMTPFLPNLVAHKPKSKSEAEVQSSRPRRIRLIESC